MLPCNCSVIPHGSRAPVWFPPQPGAVFVHRGNGKLAAASTGRLWRRGEGIDAGGWQLYGEGIDAGGWQLYGEGIDAGGWQLNGGAA